MENKHFSKLNSSKHKVHNKGVYCQDEFNASPKPHNHSSSHSSPCVARNVFEVTNNKGVLGFVAVGRRLGDDPKNVVMVDESHQTFNHMDTDLVGFSSYQANTNLPCNEQSAHVRHFSEPILDLTYQPSNTMQCNSNHIVKDSCPAPKYQTEKTRKSASREKKRKTQQQNQTDALISGHSTTTTSAAVSNNSSISPLTNERQPNNSEPVNSVDINKSQSFVNAYPLCKLCGQRHRLSENHEYDYVEEVDDDLQCDICLQPFVDPFDTKCGHTFCSICLKNYVRLKKMCPVDRKELNFTSSDCWQSSLVMRKLVDKILVHCPNTSHCKQTMPRTELTAHLKERCLGTNFRCNFAMFGCSYKGARNEHKEHVKTCKYQRFKGDPVSSIYPDCVKHTIELFRPEGIAELGIAIVGGNDTPIRNILVQTIIPGSLVDEDGRIHPNDIIIEVNGEDLHNVSHVEARTVLSRSSRLMRFVILRETPPADSKEDLDSSSTINRRISVSLLKPPSEQLGIKITTCEEGSQGIYILELVPGRVAHASGELRVGDRILEIAHVDLYNGNPEQAARVIQNAGERVDIVVSREVHDPHSTIMNQWATDQTLPRDVTKPNTAMSSKPTPSLSAPESSPMNSSYHEKVISLKKSPNESLGIIVAGGMTGVRGDLPVFVQDIQPMGILGKDKRLQRGDLLIQVNGAELTGLSHSQAISVLKDTAQHCKTVSLTAYELRYSGKEEDFALWEELSGVHHQRSRRGSLKESGWSSWTPSWKMWLAVPPRCRIPRDVVIKRGNRVGLGFSIVGGYSDQTGRQLPVFVKYVVPNSPASNQGRIRCGDEIVAINGSLASRMTHGAVIQTLKMSTSSVILSIISWPGSVH